MPPPHGGSTDIPVRAKDDPPPPMAMLAELTHRCPLRCAYCSNPVRLQRASAEMATGIWCDVLEQAAALGVLQVHFSGGEPMVRHDLPTLVAHAARAGLYSNLITSGVQLDPPGLDRLIAAGLDHIQLSFQDAEPGAAERIGGLPGAHDRKLRAARIIRRSGLPLTLNFVVHRQNLVRLPAMLDLAAKLGAARVEIAHAQYYGWALLNRDALLPGADEVQAATVQVEQARVHYGGSMLIDYVTSDYHATAPKACMGGWARRFLIVGPSGVVLPCHAAEMIPDLRFPTIHTRSLADIWRHDPAFQRFRGTAWMPPPCRACSRKEQDWGGCRCQALLLAGDATQADPVCDLSTDHAIVQRAIGAAATASQATVYRGGLPIAGSGRTAQTMPV